MKGYDKLRFAIFYFVNTAKIEEKPVNIKYLCFRKDSCASKEMAKKMLGKYLVCMFF